MKGMSTIFMVAVGATIGLALPVVILENTRDHLLMSIIFIAAIALTILAIKR